MTKNPTPPLAPQAPSNDADRVRSKNALRGFNDFPGSLPFAGSSAKKEEHDALTRPLNAWITGESMSTALLSSAARASKGERDIVRLKAAWKNVQSTFSIGVEQGFIDETTAKSEEQKKAFSCLVNAVINGWAEAIEFWTPLADARNGRTNDGMTILCVAASVLADYTGAVIDWVLPWIDPKTQDEEGRSALMIAAEKGNIAAIERLLPLSDVAAVDRHGRDALMHAVAGRPGENHEEAACRLATVSNLALRDADGASALRLAASSGAKNALGALISLQGLDAAGAPLLELAVAAEHAARASHEAKMLFLPWLGLPAFEPALREMIYMAVGLHDGEKTLKTLAPLAKGLKRSSQGVSDKHPEGLPGSKTALDLAFWMALSRKKWPKADILSMNLPLDWLRLAVQSGYVDMKKQASLLPMSFARLEGEEMQKAMQQRQESSRSLDREEPRRDGKDGVSISRTKKEASRRL